MADEPSSSRQGTPRAGSGQGNRRRRSRGRGANTGGNRQRAGQGQRQQGNRQRAGQGQRSGAARTAPRAVERVVAEPVVSVADVSAPARDDPTGAAPANRRRAILLGVAPAVIVFVLVLVIGVAAGNLAVGLAAGAVLGAAVFASLWRRGCRALLGALGARLVDEDDVPGAYNLVEGLCATMGLNVPAVYVVDDPAPNALALGRGAKDASLVLTTGLLDALDPVALEGVLAHELTHIKRDDTAPATLAAAIYLVIGVVIPGGPGAVHALAGRGRELHTDRQAVRVTRYPPGLRHALAVLSGEELPPPPSVVSRRRAGQLTRWLWTVALPDSTGAVVAGDALVGELDAASVRIAALDEW